MKFDLTGGGKEGSNGHRGLYALRGKRYSPSSGLPARECRVIEQPASRAFSGDFHAPPTPHGKRPIAVLSLGFSRAAVYHERGEITHALEFRIRIHPVDIGLPDFIGLAIDDENLSGRNLLDVVVKCRTDG